MVQLIEERWIGHGSHHPGSHIDIFPTREPQPIGAFRPAGKLSCARGPRRIRQAKAGNHVGKHASRHEIIPIKTKMNVVVKYLAASCPMVAQGTVSKSLLGIDQ